ncbi:MAG: tetratricopeptide repeat protein [Gemmatimonadales bacterium]
MRKLLLASMLGFIPAAAVAQEQWIPPQCELNTGHFLVNSAVLYVTSASRARFEDQKERQLDDAFRVIHQAVERGQIENPALWYYFARAYEMRDDLAGADSAYARAAELEPDCAEDIQMRRRTLWVPVVNEGIQAYQAGEATTAVAAFRRANTIYRTEPQGFFYLADLMGRDMNMPDSAVYYFKRALTIIGEPTDDSEHAMVQNSTYMIGRIYHINQELDSAVTWYEKYLEIDPTDGEVIAGLATVLSDLGREDEALQVYDRVLAIADQLDALDLFNAGVALFVAERYEQAAEAFELGLQQNPSFRDGLYNLANTYVAIAQGLDDSLEAEALDSARAALGERMMPYVDELVQIDPSNQNSYRLRAQSFQLRGDPDSTLALLELAEALDVDVTVDLFQSIGPGTFAMHGLITNLKDTEVNLPAVTFQFTDEQGNVIVEEVVAAQTIAAGELAEFEFTPAGEGIASWKYLVGGSE